MSYNNNFMYDAFNGDQTRLNDIRMRCGLSPEEAAKYVNISMTTFKRWLRDNSANPAALKLLAIRAGLFPWTGWDGWEMHNGYLFPPGHTKNGLLPGEIQEVIYLKQLVAEQKKTIAKLSHHSKPAKILKFG